MKIRSRLGSSSEIKKDILKRKKIIQNDHAVSKQLQKNKK